MGAPHPTIMEAQVEMDVGLSHHPVVVVGLMVVEAGEVVMEEEEGDVVEAVLPVPAPTLMHMARGGDTD